MKKLLLLFTFAFCLFTFAFAQKGTIELPATGQTTSYHAGDDGDLQEGVPIPENRFTNHDDGSATDQLTGLMWVTDANLIASRDPDFDQDRTPGDGDINWITALNYIEKLNTESYLGYNDWRMPNCMELCALINLGNNNLTLPNDHPFTNLKEGYWSSTTSERLKGNSISVYLSEYVVHAGITYPAGHFESLNKNLGPAIGYYVLYLLPVRDGGTNADIEIPQSGQTINYYNGDDGGLKTGTAWPSPRLADYNNGSVSDRLTGLMWTKNTCLMFSRDPGFDTCGFVEGKVYWETALGYINKLNTENYLGHNDWRMPNRNELNSLIDYGRNRPCIPENHPFISPWTFEGPANAHYWSSSTVAGSPDKAWVFHFGLSNLYYYEKSYEMMVWPVRTDNAGLPTGAINGTIEGAGLPKKGIEISIEGPINARTEVSADGRYSFSNLPNGSYLIKPSQLYYAFSPQSKTVNVSGAAVTYNFEANYIRAYGWIDISSNLFPVEGAFGAGLNDICFTNDDEGWISSNRDIYHTIDGGRTFEKQILPSGDRSSAIFMFNENEGYAGSSGGIIYHTINGGSEWTIFGFTGKWVLDISFPPGSTTGYSCGASGSLWEISPDGLEQIVTGINSDLMTISTPSIGNTYFNGSTGSHLWHYGGNEIVHLSTISASVYGIYFRNDTLGWMVGGGGEIGGSAGVGMYCSYTFVNYTPPNDHTFYAVHSPDGKEVWVVGTGGTIFYSPNGNDFYLNPPNNINNTIWKQEAKGLNNDFLASVFFTSLTNGFVLGNNGTLLKYTLLEGAPEGADILDVKFPAQKGEAIVNSDNNTVSVEISDSEDITRVVPEIFISAGATVEPPSGVAYDFTNPVSFKVTAADATSKTWTITVTQTSGIGNEGIEGKGFDFQIFPNPASSVVNLQSAFFNQQSAIIELFDLNGRQLLEKHIPKGTDEIEIDVSHLPGGMYVCKLSTGNKSVTKKLIIQK